MPEWTMISLWMTQSILDKISWSSQRSSNSLTITQNNLPLKIRNNLKMNSVNINLVNINLNQCSHKTKNSNLMKKSCCGKQNSKVLLVVWISWMTNFKKILWLVNLSRDTNTQKILVSNLINQHKKLESCLTFRLNMIKTDYLGNQK